MKCPLVIKLGGILLDNQNALDRFFKILVTYYNKSNRNILVVHGSSLFSHIVNSNFKELTSKKNFFSTNFVQKTQFICSTISCNMNAYLLKFAKKNNLNGIGISLSDGNLIDIDLLQSLQNKDNFFKILLKKKVGTINFLKLLFNNKFFPFLYSYGINKFGNIINFDSDIIAMLFSILLDADFLIFSDVSAVLNGKGQKIAKISNQEADFLIKKGIITDGMITKVQTALYASKILKKSIEISSWHQHHDLTLLFDGISLGTRVFYKR